MLDSPPRPVPLPQNIREKLGAHALVSNGDSIDLFGRAENWRDLDGAARPLQWIGLVTDHRGQNDPSLRSVTARDHSLTRIKSQFTNHFRGRSLRMAATNTSTVPPVQQWEDDGGAIPSIANLRTQCCTTNIGDSERIISAIAGGALLLHGLTSRSLSGFLTTIVGGGLLYRGISGHCHLYQALDMSTAKESEMALTSGCCGDEAACSAETSNKSNRLASRDPSTDSMWSTSSPEPTSGTEPIGNVQPAGPSRSADRGYVGTPGSPPPGRT